LVRQNGGTLSKKKRKLPEFEVLTDAEIAEMEKAIRDTLDGTESSPTPTEE